ncbi:simple sugar transport system permease protein [Rhodobium orientis]|uniref:Sugar ABC transporter permease n=1 Tax=Rhodobium orientis TaxID=34017 RepID=A0A327JNG5_9HYPH|nr:ABC transporter permease [Rhodobium orientis]MBB4301387.1 simple sugar transport system permease protein [Rhodobium orientis]MBK5951026.1 sugar ABC transporter permease [Rhodobium orientis]RAI27611.1 sugar ABC transporter permease [Rhodobium orientis]
MSDFVWTNSTSEDQASMKRIGRWLIRNPPVFTLILIVLVSVTIGAIAPEFWQVSNIFDMARASVVTGLFGLGFLVILAAGGIDLSFTAIAALMMYWITTAVAASAPWMPMPVILVIAALGGTIIGIGNGLLVHYLRAPALIVTIGTSYVIRGFLLTFIGTELFVNIPLPIEEFGKFELWRVQTDTGSIAILPAYVLMLVAAAVVTWWILNRTLMGRAIFAIGGNTSIAERLGYDARKVQVFVFAFSGFLAGIAGMLHVSANRIANPFDLVGTELTVIAAVVLGGARITGGGGSVLGTILGVVLITLVNNVLILAGIPSTWQTFVVGCFIVLAGAVFGTRKSA